MKNPIKDKGISLDQLGMLLILYVTYKEWYGIEPGHQITRKEIERTMGLKLWLDKHHDTALTRLAKLGYILQENRENTIYITIL